MISVQDDLATTGTPLEYWFIKLHAGDLAFLVDFIVRRERNEAEVRLSLWVRGAGRVERVLTQDWQASGAAIVIGDNTFGAGRTTGAVADIEWNLTYDAGPSRAAPSVPLLSRLHPFDLELVSRPRAAFGGEVTVSGERFDVSGARGVVTHYWGRRLPDRWHWISVDGFAGSDLALEAVVLKSRLWGGRPAMSAGYLWIEEGGRQRTLVSPLNSVITVSGTPADFTLTARPVGRPIRLRCSADRDHYNDLGEGIRQTLLGSCVLVDRGLSAARAGLEHRNWPSGSS